jgi:hypothetical protein
MVARKKARGVRKEDESKEPISGQLHGFDF